MSNLYEVIIISINAVVGVFLFKLAVSVLPDNMVTDPFKRIAAFL